MDPVSSYPSRFGQDLTWNISVYNDVFNYLYASLLFDIFADVPVNNESNDKHHIKNRIETSYLQSNEAV